MIGHRGVSLDAGALIAIERNQRRVLLLIDEALRSNRPIHVVAGALAQAWRGGTRQARLARILNSSGLTVAPLDEHTARAVGELCGRAGHDDVVDAHVVLHARQHGHVVLTTDPDDLRSIDPGARIVAL